MSTREAEKKKFTELILDTTTKKTSRSKPYHHQFTNLKAVSVSIEKKACKVVRVTLHLDSLVIGKHNLILICPTTRPRLPNGKDNFIEWDQLQDRLSIEQADSVKVDYWEQGRPWSVEIQGPEKTIAFIHCWDIPNLPQHSD